ncbi:MAG: helix-turn-helix transcriptional regulator, partial [Clostridia bacterium]|nr:helix-turn-helix transcriptional regulator [Clostridia bacterium]
MNLNFAENLKHLRKEKGITQEKLSEVLGVSAQSVSRWELAICYPDIEMLPAIA